MFLKDLRKNSNKKYSIGWIYSEISLNKIFVTHEFFINRLSENFEEIIFIDVSNFKIKINYYNVIKSDFSFKEKFVFSVPKNVIFFKPKTFKDFQSFMIDKKFIGLSNVGRSFSDLKIHYILSKLNIKLVLVSNLGNLQPYPSVVKGSLFKWIKYFLYHDLCHKLVVLLSNFKIFPKLEIRFTADKSILRTVSRNFFKKVLFKINFFYAKKILLVNSLTYDIFRYKKKKKFNKYIVLLDTEISHPQSLIIRGELDNSAVIEHYKKLNLLLDYFAKIYKKRIIISIHPASDINKKKILFPRFKIEKYKTRNLIYNASLVLFFESSAILDAVILKKPIITLKSKYLDHNSSRGSDRYAKHIGILQLDIDNFLDYNIKKSKQFVINNIKNYSSYLKNYLIHDPDSFGYMKIILNIKRLLANKKIYN